MSLQSARPFETLKSRSVLLSSPTVEDLEAQELDINLIPKEQVNMILTDRAAKGKPPYIHRIWTATDTSVYTIRLADVRATEDYHLTHRDVRPSNLYIDAVPLSMLNGSTVDYATELIGSSFRVTGNPQVKAVVAVESSGKLSAEFLALPLHGTVHGAMS